MNLTLWIIASLLAMVFLLAGANKLVIPRAKLAQAPGGKWLEGFSAEFIKGLGAVEIAGAAGLVLPAVLGTAEVLVPLAAVGVAGIMVGAIIMVARRRELRHVLLDLTY